MHPGNLFLYATTKQHFVIQLGKSYWQPDYDKEVVNKGSVVAYMGHFARHGSIGVVSSIQHEVYGVRVVPQLDVTSLNLYATIHTDDVLCIFKEYVKEETGLYRLWMEYPERGRLVSYTMTVSEDKKKLEQMCNDLKKLPSSKSDVMYYIEEV